MDNESINLYNPKLVGARFRKLRKENGWTQKELSDKLGISDRSISDIENGENMISKIDMLEKILDVFNISFDNLFEDVLIALKRNTESEIDERVERELQLMSKDKLLLANDTITNFLNYETE